MNGTRTRFAPSPTGQIHIGNVRTALFAWLVARQTNGKFILRLEDTDKNREVEGSGQYIMDSLSWLGLKWDEGVGEAGGEYGPYLQSERLDIYKEWANRLIEKGRAYADPYSPEKLQQFRDEAKANKKPFLFRNYRPSNLPKWDGSMPLRFKSDPKSYEWHDEVMGDLSSGEEVIDDFIIIKSDGYPTYNFAHIIDDHLMKIDLVIRSQEFIASVPKFLNLYEALDIKQPLLATVPYVMGPDGKKKLSKRDGAKDILDYKKNGYLPEAMLNYMASLGWNDGTEQEIFTVDELIKKFSLSHVQKSGAKLDEQRLTWINGAHIRLLGIDDLFEVTKSYFPAEANDSSDEYKRAVLQTIQERLKYFAEIPELTMFYFKDLPVNLDLIRNNKFLSQLSSEELKELLDKTLGKLSDNDFSQDNLRHALNDLLEQTGQKPAVLFSLIRIATTWAQASPELADTLSVLGKEKSLSRIETAKNNL